MIRIVAGLAKPILGTDVRDGFVDDVGVGPVIPEMFLKSVSINASSNVFSASQFSRKYLISASLRVYK